MLALFELWWGDPLLVMAGLDPAIHVLPSQRLKRVDARVKPEF